MNKIIQLLNVNKSFDNLKKLKILKKISYNFEKGKIYSLMGPSGSGKSTLLNLLSLIDRPNSGSIKIDNPLDSTRNFLRISLKDGLTKTYLDYTKT